MPFTRKEIREIIFYISFVGALILTMFNIFPETPTIISGFFEPPSINYTVLYETIQGEFSGTLIFKGETHFFLHDGNNLVRLRKPENPEIYSIGDILSCSGERTKIFWNCTSGIQINGSSQNLPETEEKTFPILPGDEGKYVIIRNQNLISFSQEERISMSELKLVNITIAEFENIHGYFFEDKSIEVGVSYDLVGMLLFYGEPWIRIFDITPTS